MATSKDYLRFILDQLSGLDGVTHRQMMGEYILYYRGKIAAYLCDDRFLVKPVPAAVRRRSGGCPARAASRPTRGRRRCCWWTGWTTGPSCAN